MKSLLYAKEYFINDSISILIPDVGSVFDNEDLYFDVISMIIATPYEMMAQLNEVGIDFTQINDYELFCLLFKKLQEMDTSLVFGDLLLSDFYIAEKEPNHNVVLYNPKTDVVIDRVAHDQICKFLRRMLRVPRVEKRPANAEAKRYMLERAKAALERKRRRKSYKSQLEEYIVALVNSKEFPYDYKSVRDISIYQFYSSLHQISHRIKFDNTMIGYYSGTIKFEDLSESDRSWISTI